MGTEVYFTDTATGNPASQITSYAFVDADAEAAFDAVVVAGGDWSDTEKEAYDNLVIAYKAAGVYANMVGLYGYMGSSMESMAVNLADPGTDLTFVNTVAGDFTANGWLSNAGTHALTGISTDTLQGLGTAGETSMGHYSGVDMFNNNIFPMGSSDGSASGALANYPWWNTSSQIHYRYRNNGSTLSRVLTAVTAPINGFIMYQHYSAGGEVTQADRNWVDAGTKQFEITEIAFNGRNQAGSMQGRGVNDYRYAHLANRRFDPTERGAMNTAQIAFQTALSRNV